MQLPLRFTTLIALLLCAGFTTALHAQTPAKEKPSVPVRTGVTATAKGVTGAVGPVAPLPRVYAPVRPREVAPKYPWRKNIPTTIFWIGELPSENNPTPNRSSSWDVNWQL